MSASIDELPSAAEEQASSSSSCADEVFNSSLHRCVSEILQDPAAAPRNEGPVDRTRRRSHRALPSNPPPTHPQGTKRRRPARFLSRVVSQDLSDPASIVINSQEATNKRQLVADTDSPKSSSSRVRIISPSLTVIGGSPPSAAATAVETHQDTEQKTLRHVSTSNDSKKSNSDSSRSRRRQPGNNSSFINTI